MRPVFIIYHLIFQCFQHDFILCNRHAVHLLKRSKMKIPEAVDRRLPVLFLKAYFFAASCFAFSSSIAFSISCRHFFVAFAFFKKPRTSSNS